MLCVSPLKSQWTLDDAEWRHFFLTQAWRYRVLHLVHYHQICDYWCKYNLSFVNFCDWCNHDLSWFAWRVCARIGANTVLPFHLSIPHSYNTLQVQPWWCDYPSSACGSRLLGSVCQAARRKPFCGFTWCCKLVPNKILLDDLFLPTFEFLQ